MECQILFSGKIRKNIINLSSAEFAYSMQSVKACFLESIRKLIQNVTC